MSFDIRMAGKIAGAGIAAFAAATILAANAPADTETPAPPPPDTVSQAADTISQAAPPTPVQHLSSPDNLPPGTSNEPVPGMESAGTAYAKAIWQAIQDRGITWRQGLILLAQRPMDPNATPPAGLAAGPQQPGPAEPLPTPEPAPLPTPEPAPPPTP